MPFDTHANLAIAPVATPPAPANSGTTIIVSAGMGARFPAVPFNATVWPSTAIPDPTNAEIVRVTGRSADTLTITRAVEGTTARSIFAGDLLAATITAKTITDIESGTNFPGITTTGTINGGHFGMTGNIYFSGGFPHSITLSTADGVDNGAVQMGGGGAADSARGATVSVFGNEHAAPGDVYIAAGNTPTGAIYLQNGGGVVRAKLHPSGAFSLGTTPDPGVAGTLSLAGDVLFTGGPHTIRPVTPDGADNGYVFLCGGGAAVSGQGAYLSLWGNESPAPGVLQILAGNVPGGSIDFYTGNVSQRGRMHNSGGFSWGATSFDPGAGGFLVGTSNAVGQAFAQLSPYVNGILQIGVAITGAANLAIFTNPNGICGYIQAIGTTTTYATSSDARLKTDRGLLTDPEVLRHTKIHHFTWNADGTAGRGVFAQEAIAVAPFAVTVGTDERDDNGLLKQPWGVDYSKYVPDLIAGWQHHDAIVTELRARITALEAVPTPKSAYYGTTDPPPVNNGSAWFSRVRAWGRGLFAGWMPRPLKV